MDFSQAQNRLASLQRAKQKGEITAEQYAAGVNLIRLQDVKGMYWQPDPNGTGWIFWDGVRWQPGLPPFLRADGSPPPPPVSSSPASVPSAGTKLMDMQEFRQISRTLPLHRRPVKWWDFLSVIIGIASAIVWLAYTGLPRSGEGFDLITPLLMIGIPFALVTYRADFDNLLLPLQPHRKKIPRLMLVGLGIAVPFLTAFILFNIAGIRNYPLMYWNMLIGTAASYAIMREPVLATGYQPRQLPPLTIPLFLLLFCHVCVRIVSADHCLTDPFNAQDCARSSGFGEAMSGGASAIVAGGINGPSLLQGISPTTEVYPATLPQSAGTGDASTPQAGAGGTVSATEQQLQNWINTNPYHSRHWEIVRDGQGNPIGLRWNVRSIKPDGTEVPPAIISVDDILKYDIYSTPVPAQMHEISAHNAISRLSEEDIRTFGSRSTWRSLPDDKRREFIQRLANTIGAEQGNPNIPVKYQTRAQGGPEFAHYDYSTGEVVINPESTAYKNRRDLINTIGHEVRHEHQKSVRGMGSDEVDTIVWRNNNDPANLYEDPSKYAAQFNERDAGSYGNKIYQHIRQRIRNLKQRLQAPKTGAQAPPPPGGSK